jgi:hypothetical protein
MFSEYFIITVDPVSVARQNIQGETLESQIASLTPSFGEIFRLACDYVIQTTLDFGARFPGHRGADTNPIEVCRQP